MKTGNPIRKSLADRFWKYVPNHPENECWEWGGGITVYGYGQFRIGGTHVAAHRVSYELRKGPIPEGLQIDHLCRNRACVNPAHLEAVTQHVNILRSNNTAANYARRTECHICGDELTFYPNKGPHGVRVCLTCQKRRDAKKRAKAKVTTGL